MALPGNKNFSDYDNYITDSNPTTSAQAQDYFRNQAELLKAVIDCDFWQPETVYQPGDVVKSDSMPNGTEAVMVATKASVTSNVEPQWGTVGGANISDGMCFWKLRFKNWGKTEEEARIALSTNLKTYTTFEQLGFSSVPTSLTALLEKIPASSQFVRYIGTNQYKSLDLPVEGILIITKGQYSNYASLQLQNYGGDNTIRRVYFENWQKDQTKFKWSEVSKTFTTYASLGFETTPTLTELLIALPVNSKFITHANVTEAPILGLPSTGILEITKGDLVEYAKITINSNGGNDVERRMWFENWQKGQNTLDWKEVAKLATAKNIDGVDFDGTADIVHYGVCETAAATAAKTVSITDFKLVTGAVVRVKFTNANTASSPTLNVNSTGAKTIMYRGYAPKTLTNYNVYEFVYDGTYWRVVGNEMVMTGASSSNAGKAGLVPQPSAGNQNAFLRGDGIWANVDAHKLPYATCSTASNTGAKVATITNEVPFALAVGATVFVKFTNGATHKGTLNVNSTGAKLIGYQGLTASGDYYPVQFEKNEVHGFMYDGTYWQCIDSALEYAPDSGGE